MITIIPGTGVPYQLPTAYNDPMVFMGKVGIGTASPFSKLHVHNNITGGDPAASGTADPNVLTRLQSSDAVFDVGMYNSGAVWMQPRYQTDFTANLSLALCPNGGHIAVGGNSVNLSSYTKTLLISAGTSSEVVAGLEIQGARSAQNSGFAAVNMYHKTTRVAAISSTRQTADDEGDLRFYTKATGASIAETFRISPAGDISTGASVSSVTGADIFKNSAVDIAVRARNNQNSIDMMVANDGSGYFRLNGTNWLNIINSSSSFIMASSGLIGVNGVSSGPNFDVRGSFGCRPPASITPTNNGDLVIQATSNTSLTFRYKGSDGNVRQGSITLAV